jgi:hypothetical protein
MKSETYPLALPPPLLKEIRRTAKETGLSLADAMRQSLKLGLPKLREQLHVDRVTNIDPLPDHVLDRIYSQPDSDPELTRKFMKAQSFDIDE